MVPVRALSEAARHSPVRIVQGATATTEVPVNAGRGLFRTSHGRRYYVHLPAQPCQVLGQSRPPLPSNRSVRREMVGDHQKPTHFVITDCRMMRAIHWGLQDLSAL